jgi:hypothetical protein
LFLARVIPGFKLDLLSLLGYDQFYALCYKHSVQFSSTISISSDDMNGPKSWLSAEKHTLYAFLNAILPPCNEYPGLFELNHDSFWTLFRQNAPPLLCWGLRAMVWLFSVICLLKHKRSFTKLSLEKQILFFQTQVQYPQRRLMIESLKVIACLAYFHDPEIQKKVRGHE